MDARRFRFPNPSAALPCQLWPTAHFFCIDGLRELSVFQSLAKYLRDIGQAIEEAVTLAALAGVQFLDMEVIEVRKPLVAPFIARYAVTRERNIILDAAVEICKTFRGLFASCA